VSVSWQAPSATASPPPSPSQAVKCDRRDRRLAACAHTFGYRGHCLTKSRRYSLRFKDLRQAREDHIREQLLARGTHAQRQLAELVATERIRTFTFAGVGHLTTADAYLAAQAAARAREHRQLAREALYDHPNRTRWTRIARDAPPDLPDEPPDELL
jgi:dGTP triphosphohydrolase